MFCYKCEQTAKGTGCTTSGVCGKQPDTAGIHDVIVKQLKDIAPFAHIAFKNGKVDRKINRFFIEALFTTVTNVNFDNQRLLAILEKGKVIKAEAVTLAGGTSLPGKEDFAVAGDIAGVINQGEEASILSDHPNEDIRSLIHLLLYGIMGMAAYVYHAAHLEQEDGAIYGFIFKALARVTDPAITVDELLELNMECGSTNLRAMELLDKGNTGRFGHPEPAQVSTSWKKGPAIIVSGHDLINLEELLKQTEGKGINVYTHGEMLPAHGYPGLKKYPHLAGHFGTAWQNQQKEFADVEAAILFNTNCIQKPRDSYKDRVFTTELVGWPGVTHIEGSDFSPVIEKALSLKGLEEKSGGMLMTGFARNAVLGVADKVVEGVKAGAIKHFFLVGGCDGAKPGRNYYTNLVEQTPGDTVVLTLACGKFRFNHLDLGSIGGIPRLLDVGQCNDAFSAVKIAVALAEAFNCGVNDLPLSIILSWYEQKAVAVLLTLLSLGIQGIKIGPSLPAFVSPAVLKVLVERFQVAPISTPEEDIKAALAG